MTQDDDAQPRPRAALERLLKVERAPASAPSPVEIQALRIDVPLPVSERVAAPVFETVRVVELRLLRMTLARKLSGSPRWAARDANRAGAAGRVVALVDDLGAGPHAVLPEVVVMNRTSSGVIERVFSVVNGAVFMGAGQCGSWEEGCEDSVFLSVLADALEAVRDDRLFQSGARDMRLAIQNETTLQ